MPRVWWGQWRRRRFWQPLRATRIKPSRNISRPPWTAPLRANVNTVPELSVQFPDNLNIILTCFIFPHLHITFYKSCAASSFLFADYEMELKERKNGESLTTCISRSTQTTVNEKEFVTVVTSNKKSPDVIVSASNMESINNTTTKRLNSNARIDNGPFSQSDVSL